MLGANPILGFIFIRSKLMEFNEYQDKTRDTWLAQDPVTDIQRCLLGILGEAGELAEINKKRCRGDFETREYIEKEKKELGDLLYYIARYSSLKGYYLEKIAQDNLKKLASRKERGKIKGSGSSR